MVLNFSIRVIVLESKAVFDAFGVVSHFAGCLYKIVKPFKDNGNER